MKKITFGTRELNKILDDTLMNTQSFPSQTLMEIAGLAIAQLTHQIAKKQNHQNICVLAGPGNNGGDGLVAARHLKMMKYNVSLVTFKKLQGKNGNYEHLCKVNGINPIFAPKDFGEPENEESQNNFKQYLNKHELILDGVFGFPFTGDIRAPYKYFLPHLTPVQDRVLSIDIPSGWDANEGNIHSLFVPKYLISLGIPKKCSEKFEGEHYLGGRFIPEKILEELEIEIPEYQGINLYTKI